MIDAPFISAFLNELEKTRGVTARTRNLRLTAIRSFFRFAAYEMPTHSAQIQRVLAMPAKRFESSAPFRFANLSPKFSKHGSMKQAPPRTASSFQACAADY